MPPGTPHATSRRSEERGSGFLPTVFGLALLLGMLGMCTNVALGLWSRTTTESIAYEAARAVATAEPGADISLEQSRAIQVACAQLGDDCARVQLVFVQHDPGDPMVALRVRAPGVGLLPRFLVDGGPVVGDLDRTIRIRREGL